MLPPLRVANVTQVRARPRMKKSPTRAVCCELFMVSGFQLPKTGMLEVDLGIEEVGHDGVLGIFKFRGWAEENEFAVDQDADAVGDGEGEVPIVRHDDGGDMVF